MADALKGHLRRPRGPCACRHGVPARAAPGLLAAALLALALTLASCDSLFGPDAAGFRTYVMGFTDFPYGDDIEDVYDTWDLIRENGDLIVLHFDGGVPWPEAYAGTAYDPLYEDELTFKAFQLPETHALYLAVTPLSTFRDDLALYRGSEVNEPLPYPWNTYTFDSPEVIAAFSAHCLRMIDRFEPDYFAYAIEANMLYASVPEDWDAFVTLAAATYTAVRDVHPELPVFVTLQADFFHADEFGQSFAIDDLLPYTDMIAVSSYPFSSGYPDADALPADHFTDLAGLAPQKPFVVAETSWPAEDVGEPYHEEIPASEAGQNTYVTRLLADCDLLGAEFVCWFFVRDFDELWEEVFEGTPDDWLPRIWRDTGLFAGDGTERDALATWRQNLARPVSTGP